MTNEERELLITQMAIDELELAAKMMQPIVRVIDSLAETLAAQDRKRRERFDEARQGYYESRSGCNGEDRSAEVADEVNEVD